VLLGTFNHGCRGRSGTEEPRDRLAYDPSPLVEVSRSGKARKLGGKAPEHPGAPASPGIVGYPL
jgi:hypothetical protein